MVMKINPVLLFLQTADKNELLGETGLRILKVASCLQLEEALEADLTLLDIYEAAIELIDEKEAKESLIFLVERMKAHQSFQ